MLSSFLPDCYIRVWEALQAAQYVPLRWLLWDTCSSERLEVFTRGKIRRRLESRLESVLLMAAERTFLNGPRLYVTFQQLLFPHGAPATNILSILSSKCFFLLFFSLEHTWIYESWLPCHLLRHLISGKTVCVSRARCALCRRARCSQHFFYFFISSNLNWQFASHGSSRGITNCRLFARWGRSLCVEVLVSVRLRAGCEQYVDVEEFDAFQRVWSLAVDRQVIIGLWVEHCVLCST